MPSAVQTAVETYIGACSERDPLTRRVLLEQCFAADGRMVTRHREIRGPAALSEMLGGFLADPELVHIRIVSEIDASGTTFRFRAVADYRDGTSPETFDAGEIDASGRISTLLTFPGRLRDAAEPTR